MHKKREISCQDFLNAFTEKKKRSSRLLQVVARMKWHQSTVWKMAE